MQGLLLINKPQNITSFGAVARIKRLSGEKRVGHTGTLDPLATGVLPIFIGRATALSSYLLEADKSYTAEIKLGVSTDTCDITGEILSEKDCKIDSETLISVLNKFKGVSWQTPPMFSALKKDGVRLYELARRGETVEIPKREITVYNLDLISEINEENIFKIDVRVSKGTYIRSLARDIGEALGCGATLVNLCRTQTGGFNIKDCVSLDDLSEENIQSFVQSEEKALRHIPELYVSERQAVRFSNGGQLGFERFKGIVFEEDCLYRVKFKDNFIGIGVADFSKNQIAVKCVINNFSMKGTGECQTE